MLKIIGQRVLGWQPILYFDADYQTEWQVCPVCGVIREGKGGSILQHFARHVKIMTEITGKH